MRESMNRENMELIRGIDEGIHEQREYGTDQVCNGDAIICNRR
jgi:hypothetical protein